MKIQDVLRQVADMMDRGGEVSSQQEHPPTTIATAEPKQITQDDGETPNTMVSPLQQELELMKKAAGVASAFDDSSNDGGCGCEGECGCDGGEEHAGPDADMDALRHMAGIKIVR